MSTSQHFGPFLKELRKSRRITLRDFCLRAELDPGNISRIERGVAPPPQEKRIHLKYATALGIEEGSEEWYLLTDLAAADKGIIPKDLMDDEELVTQLPAFFRTLRGQKPTQEELERTIELIRKS